LPRARTCLLLAALLLAGCGPAGAGRNDPAQLTVTRDFGAKVVRQGEVDADTVGAVTHAPLRWVNGVAAHDRTEVHGGDSVWADEGRPIASTPAVVGSFPEPFLHGIGGKRLPVRVECADARGPACRQVSDRLASYRIPVARGGLQTARAEETLRVLVGPWTAIAPDPAVSALEQGPRASGVYARIAADGRSIAVLDAAGRPTRTLGAGTGLVAATKRPDERPTWVVTGTDAAGVASAARAFEEGTLGHRLALAVSDDLPVALPSGG
jgi:hypothetical protein